MNTEHLNGVVLCIDSSNSLNISIPDNLFKYTEEHLENGRILIICTCPFFDGYMGVANSRNEAKVKAKKVIENVLTKIINSGSFLSYLKDKRFNIIPDGACKCDTKTLIDDGCQCGGY